MPPGKLLRRGAPRDRDPADTVATTWQLSLDQLGAVPGATALLELCAFLAPDDVPRSLLERLGGLAEVPAGLAVLAEDAVALDEAVGGLRRFGLLKASPEAVAVHRLVQQVVRDRLGLERRRELVAVALRLLQAASPNAHTDPDAWPAYAQLLSHVLAAIGHAEALGIDLERATWLLTDVGLYLWRRADYQQARTLLERALANREARLGSDQLEIAQSVHGVAVVLHAQGDLDAARALYERALAIYEARLGADHPTIATSLNDLATVLRDQGDLDAARALYERALAIREARLGADHPDTAWSLSNLANVLADQGDLDAARGLYERALAIREARLGADHPDTVRSRRNLAAVVVAELDKQR